MSDAYPLLSDPERLAQLRHELTDLVVDIATVEAEDAKYTGGFVKSLIAVHLQILRKVSKSKLILSSRVGCAITTRIVWRDTA